MKTQLKLFLLLALLLALFKGNAQCISTFTSNILNAGYVEFYPQQSGYSTSWDFGDGSAQTTWGGWLGHTYSSGGTFIVCATVVDSMGTCTSTSCDTIQVSLCNNAARFYFLQNGFGLDSFSYANPQTLPGTSLAWDFGDGGGSTLVDPVHQYTADGNYNVCLTVSDPQQGCADTSCRSISVTLCSFSAYVADFVTAGTTANYIVPQTVSGYSYTWHFDDGGSAIGTTATHTYSTYGNHTYCLVYSDALTGCIDSVCQNEYFVADSTPCFSDFLVVVQPGTVSIYDSISSHLNFSWDFGDGTTLNVNSPYFTHTYTTAGTYNICLTTSNPTTGCTSTTCHTIVYDPCQNLADYSYNTIAFGEDAFNATYSNVSGLTFQWDYGDGYTAAGNSVSHTFAASGNYTVCLTTTNANAGCSATNCISVPITLCSFVPDFIYDTTGGSIRPFVVSNQVAGYTYSWDFGDGNTATGTQVTHVFGTSQIFHICLTAYDPNTGCTNSNCKDIYFDRCGFGSINIGYSNNGVDVVFNANVYPYNTGYVYSWTFPGATPSVSSDPRPAVTYNALGQNQVCVQVNNTGCVDTICQSIYLTPAQYSISGSIIKGGSAACATVYLIRQDTLGHLTLIDSLVVQDTMGLCNGYYQFYNIPVDSYYVKAALQSTDPDYANYLPTYYVQDIAWTGATPIYVSTGNVAGINIDLVAGNNPGGPGFVGGWVSQGAGLTVAHGSGNGRATGDPLGGVQISLLTSTEQAVAYTYTDASGHYQFSNLALGDYLIYAEQLNKIPTKIPFSLTAQNPGQTDIDIAINSNSAVATSVDAINGFHITNVYPNPVLTGLTVEISSGQHTTVDLRLTDVLGNNLINRKQNVNAGDNKILLDMQSFAGGVYQLTLVSGNNTLTYKVVKEK